MYNKMYNKQIWLDEGPRHVNNFMGGGSDFFNIGPISVFSFSLLTMIFIVGLAWIIAIKGYALWTAAQRKEKWWFIALLVINTLGILELVYLVFVARKFDRVQETTKEANEHALTSEEKGRHDVHKSHEAHKNESDIK